MANPRVLTDRELLEFEQTERCHRSWWFKSLLLTIAAIREEHYYELETTKSQVGELQNRLKWFEATYSVRAFEPLRQPRKQALHCPYCEKHGAVKITFEDTEYWACLDCRKTWESTVPAETANIERLPSFETPIIATGELAV
jgi:ribosomal protein L37AE/L43A